MKGEGMKLRTIGAAIIAAFSLNTMADSGMYAEVSLGSASQELTVESESASGSDIATSLEVGYRANQYFAIGLAYHNFGDASMAEYYETVNDVDFYESLTSTASGLGLVINLETDNTNAGEWTVGLRGGAMKLDAELGLIEKQDGQTTWNESVSENKNLIFFGAHVGYNFTDNVQVKLGIDQYSTKLMYGDTEFEYDLAHTKLALRYNF
jgi:hypothetical protein